jgi:enoyl-[acyl-carrier-protein] reductase (NADH)
MGGRVTIVTGAGTGIRAAARLLAANGLEAVLVGRRAQLLETVRAVNVNSSVGSMVKAGSMLWHLVAPDSAGTTGNVIHVDGGQVLGLPGSAGG